MCQLFKWRILICEQVIHSTYRFQSLYTWTIALQILEKFTSLIKDKTKLRGKVISSFIWLMPFVKLGALFQTLSLNGTWICGACHWWLVAVFCILKAWLCYFASCVLWKVCHWLLLFVTFHIEWHHFHHTSPHLRALGMSRSILLSE